MLHPLPHTIHRLRLADYSGALVPLAVTPKEGCFIWPEFVQFLAFFLLTVAALKVGATFLIHRNPGSVIGNGLGWFVPGIA